MTQAVAAFQNTLTWALTHHLAQRCHMDLQTLTLILISLLLFLGISLVHPPLLGSDLVLCS